MGVWKGKKEKFTYVVDVSAYSLRYRGFPTVGFII